MTRGRALNLRIVAVNIRNPDDAQAQVDTNTQDKQSSTDSFFGLTSVFNFDSPSRHVSDV